jgi:PAS domain S-box-containing protein
MKGGPVRLETVGLWIAIAASIGTAVIGYRTTEELVVTTREVDRTHRAIDALDQVLVSIGSAGTARRAYLLGGEGAEIQRFATAGDEARRALDEARALADRGPADKERFEHIQSLLDERWSTLAESVERRRQGLATSNEPPTRADVDSMARLRSAILDTAAESRRNLTERQDRADRSATVAKDVELCGTALTAVILILAFARLRRTAARERAARQSADRATRFLDSVVENLPAMVFIKEAEALRFDRINQAGEALLGVNRRELLGKSDKDFFPEDQALFFQTKDRQTLAKRVVVDIPEEPIETKQGRRWLHTRKVPLLDESGEPRFLLGISVDITERKHAAEALRQAKDRAEAVSRELEAFSYSVAHDLRAPLRSIDGFSLALLEDSAGILSDVCQKHLHRIQAAAQRMGELIDDMLSLSRLSRTNLQAEEVDLSELAAASVADLRQRSPEREVAVQIEPSLKTRGDRRLLRIVFDNLLSNAFKFTGRHPRATIEVGTTLDDGRRVYFVRDDGVGFDERYAEKLFGAFQRLHDVRDFPGSGIGLATVQRIVSRHGGRVWARGAPDRGATFSFTLGESPADAGGP